MIPPSTRMAAPLVADANGLEKYTTVFATSSVAANLCNNEVGLLLLKKFFSASAIVMFPALAISCKNTAAPDDFVGPGKIAFTVTPLPLVSSAKPLLTARIAVFVMP